MELAISKWHTIGHYQQYYKVDNELLIIYHNGGFFSCSTIRLESIIEYFNIYNKLPKQVDSSMQYNLYKSGIEGDITQYFFEDYNKFNNIDYESCIYTTYEPMEQQFSNYQKLNFDIINKFMIKYFTPSQMVHLIIDKIEKEYNINYENTCAVFYRGNLKSKETNQPKYSDYLEKIDNINVINPNIKFLFQSDETEFIEYMVSKYSNNIIFKEYIRHISKDFGTEADWCDKKNNLLFSLNFLAITNIMSKCKYVICNSGNCSLWILLYRGNCNNVIQYLDPIGNTCINNSKWIQ